MQKMTNLRKNVCNCIMLHFFRVEGYIWIGKPQILFENVGGIGT